MNARQKRRLHRKLARTQNHTTFQMEPRALASTNTEAESVTQPETPQSQPETAPALSEARLSANRANAQLSSGPTSTAGKQIASQNSARHGLTGTFRVLGDESQAQFDDLLKGFLRAEAPVGAAEIEMVEQMAQASWLSRRSVRLQDKCILALQSGDPERERAARKDLALYMRYQTTHDRAFIRFSVELRKCRNERRRTERGFVSQKLREAREQRRGELDAIRRATENRKQERHEMKMRLERAKCERLENIKITDNAAPKTAAASANCYSAAA